MLSIKKVVVTILITVLISVLILAYNFSQDTVTYVGIENDISTGLELKQSVINTEETEYKYLVVGETNAVSENITTLFSLQKLNFTQKEKVVEQDLLGVDIIVFCNDVVSENIDLQVLGKYIENGGKIILAAGLPEGSQDSYLNPYLGIVEKTIKEPHSNFSVVENFLPYGESEIGYDGFSATTWISIQDDAEVYVSTKDKNIPVIYSYTYGKGESMVINASILEDKDSVGIITSAMAELLTDFIYPIMGVKLIFLDNFPIATELNDSESLMLYGRDTESFVLDRIWPLFQSMGLRNDIKYTAGILTAANYENAFPTASENLIYSIGKSTLQYGGELVFLGNFLGKDELAFNTTFTDSFYEVFGNYEVNGFAVQAGNIDDKIFSQVKQEYPDVDITRVSTGSDATSGVISQNDGIYNLPIMSSGINWAESASFNMVSNMSAYGLLSHRFDINRLMGFTGMETTWEENKELLSEFEEKVYTPLHWLEPVTLSQSQDYLEGFLSLDYVWGKNADDIEINCTNLKQNQAFLFRTDKVVQEVQGGSFEKINEHYYLIKIFDTTANIILEE